MTISITIIGHNEADHLEELLPQLHWADEIIYVDCESQDASLKIAHQNKCRVFSRPNNPNLNVNKSYGMEQATGEWIIYIDPDERISNELSNEICTIAQGMPQQVAFQCKRRNHYFGQWLRHGSQYPDFQLRMFRRGKASFKKEHVHEKLQVDGNIGQLKNDLLHYPYLNISQFLKKLEFYTSFEAQFLKKQNVRITWKSHLKYLIFVPWTRFLRRYFLKLGCLDGLPGLFCALFDAINIVLRYFKLWELYRNDETSANPNHTH